MPNHGLESMFCFIDLRRENCCDRKIWTRNTLGFRWPIGEIERAAILWKVEETKDEFR